MFPFPPSSPLFPGPCLVLHSTRPCPALHSTRPQPGPNQAPTRPHPALHCNWGPAQLSTQPGPAQLSTQPGPTQLSTQPYEIASKHNLLNTTKNAVFFLNCKLLANLHTSPTQCSTKYLLHKISDQKVDHRRASLSEQAFTVCCCNFTQ